MDELRTVEKVDRPQTPCTPPPSRAHPPEGTPQRRGDFTRQEYERRHQLKIMEDLDKVLRQKPTTVRGVKKQRPKTVFHDDSALSRSPAKGFMGKYHLSVFTLPIASVGFILFILHAHSSVHAFLQAPG